MVHVNLLFKYLKITKLHLFNSFLIYIKNALIFINKQKTKVTKIVFLLIKQKQIAFTTKFFHHVVDFDILHIWPHLTEFVSLTVFEIPMQCKLIGTSI